METIQTILDAEQEARELIQNAKQEHGKQLEEAQGAEREKLERYRRELDTERTNALRDIEKDLSVITKEVQEDQKKEQARIEEQAHAHHDKAVAHVVNSITDLPTTRN